MRAYSSQEIQDRADGMRAFRTGVVFLHFKPAQWRVGWRDAQREQERAKKRLFQPETIFDENSEKRRQAMMRGGGHAY